MTGWRGWGWDGWRDAAAVRALLDAGADPDGEVDGLFPVLHFAAEYGSAAVVAEIAGRVAEVDAESEGRTALWAAVYADRPEAARELVAAGADPWRPMMAGWSPARLALASATPDLFGAGADLSPAEAATVAEARRLLPLLTEVEPYGLSLAGASGIDVAEAVGRLGAAVVAEPGTLVEDCWADPMADAAMVVLGVTDVPGGCVLVQPWGPVATHPAVLDPLSAGGVCLGVYANPKSGNQGAISRDGEGVAWDLHPGGEVAEDAEAEDVLTAYLCRGAPVAWACTAAGLRLADARAVSGPPDAWIRLPRLDS